MSAPQRLKPHLGKAPVQNLSLSHEVLNCSGDVLDRDFGVDPVLIKEVDAVGAKALEHPFDSELDVLGLAVEPWAPLTCLEIDVPAELRCDDDLVSEGCDTFAEDAFHFERAVRLRRIEEVDATVEGCSDDVDHFAPGRDRRLISAAHVLHAEADR